MSESHSGDGAQPILELVAVQRWFEQASGTLEVLRGVDLVVHPGEIVALVGPSGAGKSTLLQIAGLLERPSDGDIILNGRSAGALSDGARTALRRLAIGYVYQFHHLLPEFSALENVAMPQIIAGVTTGSARHRAADLLGQVGLAARTDHRPKQLSGGEQQRVAIARALANRPRLLLADEPTGNLDHATADSVFELLRSMIIGSETGALVATHNLELAGRMNRIIELVDGRVVN